MKWFKHFADAHDDEKLSEVLCIHGPGAYGVFWLIVEAIATQMDKSDRCSARYHYKKWATIAHVDRRTLTRYLQTFNILTLIVSQECDNFVTIEIPKLLSLRDNYTKDLQATTRKTSKQEVEVEVEVEVEKKSKRKQFIPPTPEEVKAYCLERNKGVDFEKWIDHYTSNGWMVGKNKMKDWKAAVRTWEKNTFNGGQGNDNNRPQYKRLS